MLKTKDERLKDFVSIYKKKPKPKLTVMDFLKQNNHEIWRKCPVCGDVWDARKGGLKCDLCNIEGITI